LRKEKIYRDIGYNLVLHLLACEKVKIEKFSCTSKILELIDYIFLSINRFGKIRKLSNHINFVEWSI